MAEAIVHLLEVVHIHEEEAATVRAILAGQGLLDARHSRLAVENAREPIQLGLLPQRGLAHNHIVGVQKTTHMANGTTDAVEQHERLVAAPDGVALRIG